jgi:hypothetical protein
MALTAPSKQRHLTHTPVLTHTAVASLSHHTHARAHTHTHTRSDADVVCAPAKQAINYAKPQLLCPPGCQLTAATGSCACVCVSGFFGGGAGVLRWLLVRRTGPLAPSFHA